jgi:5-methylcytosine-specific restriction endonuclease McrBC regulatory subunit McrC
MTEKKDPSDVYRVEHRRPYRKGEIKITLEFYFGEKSKDDPTYQQTNDYLHNLFGYLPPLISSYLAKALLIYPADQEFIMKLSDIFEQFPESEEAATISPTSVNDKEDDSYSIAYS